MGKTEVGRYVSGLQEVCALGCEGLEGMCLCGSLDTNIVFFLILELPTPLWLEHTAWVSSMYRSGRGDYVHQPHTRCYCLAGYCDR